MKPRPASSPLWLFQTLALFGASLLTCAPTLAQSAAAPAVDTATLAKYDRNKNGVLDPDEMAALQAAGAKGTSVPVEKSGTRNNEVLELSPFQVTASDKGYLASNTLSGTRLNSKLEDLGASITVITKQQMLDTAALDINDIFLYEANTEGTGNFTSFTVDRNGGVNDNVQGSPQTSNRVRGLDTVNTARDNFTSNSNIPIDPYNIDAVELSRGPNSNIFGLGNSSGTVNIITSQANPTRNSASVALRVDSYGGYRGSLDVNHALIPNQLAIRFSTVHQTTAYQRKPSADETNRYQIALAYRPFAKTKIKAAYENYRNYARRPNSVTPRDAVTYWKGAGQPVWDPTTQRVTFANGTTSGPFTVAQDGTLPLGLLAQGTGFYNRPSIYVDGGGVRFWSVNRTGTVPTTGLFTGIPTPDNPNTNLRFLESGTDLQRQRASLFPLFVTPSITDQSLYDWTSINFVAPNYNKDSAGTYTAELEQTFLSTPSHFVAARVDWFKEDFDNYSRNFIGGTNSVLYVDVNQKLLDGTANPYFLRPYIAASEPTLFRRPSLNDIQSADLAYKFTPEKLPRWLSWIGQQKLNVHGEARRLDTATFRYRDAVVDDHTWINLQNRTGITAARAYYKYYVGDNQGQNIDLAPPAIYNLGGRYNFTWFNAQTNQWVNEPSTIAEAGVTPSSRTRREIRTLAAAAQSFFFDNRLVTTFGWRKDKNRSRDSSGAVVNPTTGFLDYSPLKNWGQWFEKSGTTRTAGAVIKPFPWVNAYYNQSDSFLPANTQFNLFGNVLPNPTGTGKDYGLTFNLLDGKLVVKLNRYNTLQINSRAGDAGIVATRAIRLDTGRSGNGNDSFNFETWAANLALGRFIAQGILPTATQLSDSVATIMGLPPGFLDSLVGKSIAETSDISAKGYELEVNYNPTPNWTVKLTGAQQITIDSNISPTLIQYLESRLPIWTTVKDDAGLFWWKTSIGGGGVPENFYLGNVSAPLKLAIANQGKPRSQVREWRLNMLTNYNFTTGRLKNFGVGGALRWEDQASIGFFGAAPEADGVIRSLDVNRPVYDKARFYVDLSASYRLRLHKDRIRARIQLNVRNVLENGRLQPVAVNPNGQPYAYRIIDPRQFILSTSFDL